MASAGAVRPEAAGFRRNSIDRVVEREVRVLPVEKTRQKGTKGFALVHDVPRWLGETLLLLSLTPDPESRRTSRGVYGLLHVALQ
jgi:hypothetical protein